MCILSTLRSPGPSRMPNTWSLLNDWMANKQMNAFGGPLLIQHVAIFVVTTWFSKESEKRQYGTSSYSFLYSLSAWKFPSWKLILFRNKKTWAKFTLNVLGEDQCIPDRSCKARQPAFIHWNKNLTSNIWCSGGRSVLCFVNMYVLFKEHWWTHYSVIGCRILLILELRVLTNAHKIPESWSKVFFTKVFF